MLTTTTDQPGVEAAKFSASFIETPGLEHSLTVDGEASGDYRVKEISLVRAKHQGSEHTLTLDVETTLGPVENPHPELERVFPLRYQEAPAMQAYTHIRIINGRQHFTIEVEDVL